MSFEIKPGWFGSSRTAELYSLPGESHLAGLGRGEEILRTMLDVWDREDQR